MKNSIKKELGVRFFSKLGFLGMVVLTLVTFQTCEEETQEEVSRPSTIQFSASVQNVTEGNEATITLLLDKAAPQDVSIDVSIETNAIYSQHYTTEPAVADGSIVIAIEKGQTTAEVVVTTVDNSLFEGTKFIIFTISTPSEGLKIGTATSLTLTMGDDEGPSLANFSTNTGTLPESNSAGISVNIPLSAPAKGAGSITVVLDPDQAILGIHFTTDPAPTNNTYTFSIEQNQTGVAFTFLPIDNELFTNNFNITFSIVEASGVVLKGNNLNYSLTLEDDELPSIANFENNSGIASETNISGIEVMIPFSSPAKGTGTITINFNSTNATYGKDFITSPAASGNQIAFNILTNETSASFTVLPIHDFVVTQNLQITFNIATVSGVIQKGTSLSYSLTIINEDVEALVNFSVPSGVLTEDNADGIIVEIPFSAQAPGEGSITISLSYVGPGQGDYQFATVPAATYTDFYHNSSTIILSIEANQSSASFKILPVNNSYCNAIRHVQCKISFAYGSVKRGTDLDFDLALIDDEEATVVSFAESSGIINEANGAGVSVQLNFSKPLQEEGSLSFSTEWWTHQNRLITNPAFDYNCYWYCYDPTLYIPSGEVNASFNISPLNNGTHEANYVANFSLYAYSNSGCLQVAPDSKYTLTIMDDD